MTDQVRMDTKQNDFRSVDTVEVSLVPWPNPGDITGYGLRQLVVTVITNGERVEVREAFRPNDFEAAIDHMLERAGTELKKAVIIRQKQIQQRENTNG